MVAGKEEKGQQTFSASHGGYQYLFAAAAHAQTFRAHPEKYGVQDNGNCPVAKAKMSREIKGSPSIFAVHKGKIYLFANADARDVFKKNPDQFVKGGAEQEGSGH